MENLFTPTQGFTAIAIYGLIMVTIALIAKRNHSQDRVEFLLAGRNVGMFFGALSAAVSWIWAPALFVGAQKAYEQGMSGLLAFATPNFLALMIFAVIALKARKAFPNGFTLPQLMAERYGKKVHYLYMFQFFGLQICSFAIQLLAGSTLISVLTGLDFTTVAVSILTIALVYSLIGGLRGSILTDVLQMVLIIGVIWTVVPGSVSAAGGFDTVVAGFGGLPGFTSWFDPWVFYSFGIPVAITLITGPVADQMQWQRAFAIKSNKTFFRTYVIAACLFISVPLTLSALGFLAANPAVSAEWAITSPGMVGPIAVSYLMPKIMLVAFAVMLLSGLCSTLDSILCAVSALTAIDVFKTYENPEGEQGTKVLLARIGMLAAAGLALAITLLPGIKLIYLWLFTTAFRAPNFIPTILTLFWRPLNPNAVFWGILSAMVIGGGVYMYGALNQAPHLIVIGSILPLVISSVVCVAIRPKK